MIMKARDSFQVPYFIINQHKVNEKERKNTVLRPNFLQTAS